MWVCDAKRGGRRRKEGDGNGKYKGGGREEGLREDGWTVLGLISERNCWGRECATELRGGVYRHTQTHIKMGLRRRRRKTH